ncbi:MAG: hypothetical protein EOP06_04695 [Proteobacteria bacterium]|nr:MAG: hypothetical protein EOP06_04695 [Pseudomonadota bacterium]
MRLKSEAGFGMITVLIATFVGALVVAGFAQSIMTMIASQKSTELALTSHQIGDEFTSLLSTKQGCTTMLANRPVPTSPGALSNLQSPGPTLSLATGPFVANSGSAIPDAQGLVVDRAFLAGTADNVATLSTGLTRRIVTANLQVKKQATGLFSPSMRPTEVRIHTMVNAANSLQACIAETPEVLACIQNGGIYDPSATNPSNACLPYLHCQYGGSYVSGSGPGAFGNQLNGGLQSCAAGWTAQQTGTVSEAYDCGKNKVCNRFTPVVTCMQCSAAVSTSGVPTVINDVSVGAEDQLNELDENQDFIDHQLECEAQGKTLADCPYNPPN